MKKCPNTDFFLVRIFPYSVRVQHVCCNLLFCSFFHFSIGYSLFVKCKSYLIEKTRNRAIFILQYTFFSIVTHFITAYHISVVNVQTNYCNNYLLILDLKQLSKITKFYYFYTLKALCDGQGKNKMYYGISRVKK